MGSDFCACNFIRRDFYVPEKKNFSLAHKKKIFKKIVFFPKKGYSFQKKIFCFK